MHLRNSCTRSMSRWAMRQVPSGASGGRGLKGAIFAFTRKFHDTSVTRSRMRGKARMGSIVTGCSSGSEFSRVMHMSRGRPLISAEHEPHLPALQFQRHARSGACSACTWCTASSTTMPSEISVRSSRNAPPLASPRQILKVAVGIPAGSCLLVFLNDAPELGRHLGQRTQRQLHLAVGPAVHADVLLPPLGVLVGEVLPIVAAAAL